MPIPELRTLLNPFRTRAAAPDRRRGSRRGEWRGWRRGAAGTGGRGLSGRRPRTGGSALVVSLMAGLIALIGAFVLASRLFSSRFNTFARSDTLAAREAAEFGLNEVQALLNTNQRSYLWVTRPNRWNAVDIASLNACQVSVQDASGNAATSLAALPAGLSGARTIRNDGGATITYELVAFEPPSLPDDNASTTAQTEFCSNATAAANFGNLNGGSALITVQGTVTRGGRSSSFRMSRRSHVASTIKQPAFSFMILGDAYEDKATKEVFGAKSDISNLNYLDGNICYGKITDTTCFTTPPLPKTIIGCRDLGSCLINNVFNNNQKDKLSKYCADVKAKKKKKAGYTCNEFQQAPELPAAPTPRTEGFLNDSGILYTDADWNGTDGKGKNSKAVRISCDLKDGKCNKSDARFPYSGNKVPSSLSGLKNSDLVDGCYFNNVNSQANTSYSSATTAINCLFSQLEIVDDDKNNPNLMVYTTTAVGSSATKLLPVNIFLYGDPTDTKYSKIKLKEGGIDSSDRSELGWSRLRIFGKEVATSPGDSVSCSESPMIESNKENDLNNLFLWLPNAALEYKREASKDNSYMVVWTCRFDGPTKDKIGNQYSIITPLPESLVRAGLASTLGSRFIQSSAGSYRGYGSEDAPAQ